jgi:hypothetical protein
MSEEIKETPTGELEQGEFKLKKKPGRPKKLTNKKDETVKIDLSKKEEPKKEEDAVQTQETSNSDAVVEEKTDEASSEKVVEEVRDAEEVKEEQEIVVLNEITEETEEVKEIIEDIKEEVKENPQIELPENIEKLVSFMQETGGTVEDYVRLNADYSNISEEALLNEYYKNTRPHLDPEEVKFLMEDNFEYDEDVDDERDIRKKKLARKEEIAKARKFLEDTKSKYYDEIKLRPGVTQDQQKAMDFFNRYNEEQKMVQQNHNNFKQNTLKYFNQEFKGFDFSVGEKKFRYNVNNTGDVASNQSDLTNLIGKFLDNKGEVKDYKGYHKAIFAAQNADTIANHFYEQGKADATKDIMAKSKNISNEPRQTSNGEVYINGLKVRAISGVDSSKLKIKTKK